jgi:hypothetical protein
LLEMCDRSGEPLLAVLRNSHSMRQGCKVVVGCGLELARGCQVL